MLKKIKTYFEISIEFVLDLIFPKYCVGCEKEGAWICPTCQSKIILIKSTYCPTCHRLTKDGKFCPRCKLRSYLAGVVVAAHYKEGPLKEAIHTYKYEGVFDLKKDLSKILIQALATRKFQGQWILIPVPLHKNKLHERGYNQSLLLCEEIHKKIDNFSILNNKLIKKINTTSQVTSTTRHARLKNPIGSFDWIGGVKELENKNIILVDDIYTTGATMQECAKILKAKAKAKKVWGLVLAQS